MGQMNLWGYTGTAGAPTRQVKLPWDKWGIGGSNQPNGSLGSPQEVLVLQPDSWGSTETFGGLQHQVGFYWERWASTGKLVTAGTV